MKPAPFEYHDPATLEQVIDLLGSLDNAKVLAGGQSLMPMLAYRYVMPDHLIDVNKIAELSGIVLDASTLRIGATTRQRDIEFSETIARHAPLFQAGLEHVGHRQTRNRGPIGGSLSHADPSAELPNIASAYDARIVIDGPHGRRTIPFAEFSLGFMTTAVEPDEILCGVEIDCWDQTHGYSFQEYARRRGDFAVVGVAALLESNDGAISRASVSVCGIATGPVRLPELEAALVGSALDNEEIEDLSDMVAEIDAIEDHHASAQYRQHLARTLTVRALRQARDRIGTPR
jgi:carbon-monoxide dehydrogenase medium subunit